MQKQINFKTQTQNVSNNKLLQIMEEQSKYEVNPFL